jgi:hypothetical protein
MPQHDYDLANSPGITFRADVNAVLEAIATKNSGATAPATTFPFMAWLDTTANLLKIRNAADNAWVTVASLSGTTWIPYRAGAALGTAAVEDVGVADGDVPQMDATGYPAADGSQITSIGLPRSYLAGLGLSNNGADPTNDIDIAIGEARNADDDGNLKLASAFTKRIDANWAVGTGAGGFSSSLTLADDTWYHVHLILVAGVVDVGFDTSVVAANLIADHSATEYRRIGSVLRGTATLVAFSQVGDEFLWLDPPLDVNSTTIGQTASTETLTVPTGVQVRAKFIYQQATESARVYYSSLDANDEAPANGTAPLAQSHGDRAQMGEIMVRTNTSGQIRLRADVNNIDVDIATLGWIDRRGRDD